MSTTSISIDNPVRFYRYFLLSAHYLLSTFSIFCVHVYMPVCSVTSSKTNISVHASVSSSLGVFRNSKRVLAYLTSEVKPSHEAGNS